MWARLLVAITVTLGYGRSFEFTALRRCEGRVLWSESWAEASDASAQSHRPCASAQVALQRSPILSAGTVSLAQVAHSPPRLYI